MRSPKLQPTSEFDILQDFDYLAPRDIKESEAREHLRRYFDEHREEVFFSRQIEVQNEDVYFHWITNRAIRELIEEGTIRSEVRMLRNGGSIKLLWHRGYRFYRRSASRLVSLVEEYADPNVGGELGLRGEWMILEGFARCQFVMRARHAREFGLKTWTRSEHNLDFIFERDSVAYGVEVKNTLGYLDRSEFETKIDLCGFLGVRPVFAARMLPRTWIHELNQIGGFALILKYQLYPWSHRELAKRVSKELGLPVDTPRALADGTMARFVKWHAKNF
jgi:hypothetical protein